MFNFLFQWPDFDGYGFNLHAEKNKPGKRGYNKSGNKPGNKARTETSQVTRLFR